MTSCEHVPTCPLFAQFALKSSLRVWRTYYCEEQFERCERWKMVAAGKPVPASLLPNGRMLEVPVAQLDPRHMS